MPSSIERDFLRAAVELAQRQREILPYLADSLGQDPYAYWILDRLSYSPPTLMDHLKRIFRLDINRFRQDGQTLDGEWAWFFHGLEVDMWHTHDGRFVRIDFGPLSQRLVITGWGVLQFVMTSKSPWNSYDDLYNYLYEKPTKRREWSGNHERMSEIEDVLVSQGYLVSAAPEICDLVERYTTSHSRRAND